MDSRLSWVNTGRMLRRIHELPRAALPPFDWKGSNWVDFVRAWLSDLILWLRTNGLMAVDEIDGLEIIGRAGMERLSEPSRVFLHGDCQPFHYLLDPKTSEVVAAIDFGDAGTGDPLWDITTVCSNRDRRSWLLEGYGADRLSEGDLNPVLDAYYVLRHMSAVGWLVENDFNPAPSIALLRDLLIDP